MNDSDLEELLKETDAASSRPLPRHDLAGAVQRRYRNQRRSRVLAGTTLVLLVAASLLILPANRSQPPVAVNAPTSATIENELVMLDARIQLHTLTADRLIAAHRRTLKPANAPLGDFELERDRAALILIYDAERYLKHQRINDAVAAYRRTIELFPQSHWAQVAERRLKEI